MTCDVIAAATRSEKCSVMHLLWTFYFFIFFNIKEGVDGAGGGGSRGGGAELLFFFLVKL